MTDIVERLRNIANPEGVAGWSSLLTEAADEIERLRANAGRWYSAYWDFVNHINRTYGYPEGSVSPVTGSDEGL